MLLFFAFIGVCGAAAQIKITGHPKWPVAVNPGTPEKPSVKDYSNGYYVSFLDVQTHLGEKATYTRLIRNIEAVSGIQNGSEVTVVFDPSYEQIAFHDISIWRNGVRLPQLKTGRFTIVPIETERDRFLYNGSYSASFVLKDVRKGDRIEYAFTRKGWNPVFQGKFGAQLYFSADDFIGYCHQAFIAPQGQSLYLKSFNNAPEARKRTIQGQLVYEWEIKGARKEKVEEFEPSWWNSNPRVQVSSYKTWQEVVDWGLSYYSVPKPASGVAAAVASLRNAADGDTNRYIDKAVRFVQDDIRYLGVEIGENSHRPHSPEETLRHRYGDCKDKALLLAALLQAYGMAAYPVLVSTFTTKYLGMYLPSPLLFNHAITVVEIAGQRVWIDPTISLQGGRFPNYGTPSYGEGLILKPGNSGLVAIKNQAKNEVIIRERISVPRDAASQGDLEVHSTFIGSNADRMRVLFDNSRMSEIEEGYIDYYRNIYQDATLELLDSLKYTDERDYNRFLVNERYSLKGGWRHDSIEGKEIFPVPAQVVYDQLIRLSNSARKSPVGLNFPYALDYHIILQLPEAWSVEVESWEVVRDSYRMQFSSEYNPESYTWTLKYRYETFDDNVAADKAAQYREDVQKFTTFLEYRLHSGGHGNSAGMHSGLLGVWGICIALFSVVAVKGYRYSNPAEPSGIVKGERIGGWLYLLGVGVTLNPLALMGGFFESNNHPGVWGIFNGTAKELAYKGILLAETAGFAALFVFSMLLAILFFQRRDTFPRFFLAYSAFRIVFSIADSILIFWILESSKRSEDLVTEVVRAVIYGACWSYYLTVSKRAEVTFVRTYEAVKNGSGVYSEAQAREHAPE